jgi:hypothetical protein
MGRGITSCLSTNIDLSQVNLLFVIVTHLSVFLHIILLIINVIYQEYDTVLAGFGRDDIFSDNSTESSG